MLALHRFVVSSTPAPALATPILRARGLDVCCNSALTIHGIAFSITPHRVITLVNPSNYNGDAILHYFGHAGSVVPKTQIRNQIHCRNRSLCTSNVSPMRIHHHVNVIFRGPGPFPGSVCRGVTFKTEVGNCQNSVSRLMRQSLHDTTL